MSSNEISHGTGMPKPLLTMTERVSIVMAELGLGQGQPVAKAVAAANEEMGIEGKGPLAAQVAKLLEELGINAESKAVSHMSANASL